MITFWCKKGKLGEFVRPCGAILVYNLAPVFFALNKVVGSLRLVPGTCLRFVNHI